MTRYLGFACVGLVLTLVATATVMSVEDRRNEHAVLQTLGVSPARVFRFIVGESLILSTAGGIIGVSGAIAILKFSHLSVGAEAVAISFTPSTAVAANGLVVSAIAGILAGVAPGIRVATTEIVPALRHS